MASNTKNMPRFGRRASEFKIVLDSADQESKEGITRQKSEEVKKLGNILKRHDLYASFLPVDS